jgi:hypothetical protein
MEMKPITISFKQTEEERALYEIIKKHSSKGSFIKDTLIDVLVKKSNAIQEVAVRKNIESDNELNEIFDM